METKKRAVKLTAEQRAEVKSLIEDSGYSRRDALAMVAAYPPAAPAPAQREVAS